MTLLCTSTAPSLYLPSYQQDSIFILQEPFSELAIGLECIAQDTKGYIPFQISSEHVHIAKIGQRDSDVECLFVEKGNQVIFLAHDTTGDVVFTETKR